MTDAEKRDLSERLARLAEAAGLPAELVRSPDTAHCPEGHMGKPHWPACLHEIPRPGLTMACAKPLHADPLDLTNPTHLLPLVEAWLAKDSDREWASKYHDGEWIAWVKDLPRYPEPGSDPDRTVAEALTLCAAMEAERN